MRAELSYIIGAATVEMFTKCDFSDCMGECTFGRVFEIVQHVFSISPAVSGGGREVREVGG